MGLPGRYSDLWLAACIVLLCCWGTWRTYSHVIAIEQGNTAVLGALPQGHNRYALLVKEKCVGEFNLDIAHKGNYLVQGKLDLRTAFGRLKSNGKAEFKAEFNPIGQFTQGNLAIALLGTHLEVNAENVNPIQVNVAFGKKGEQIKKEFALSGPLMIVQESDQSFRLEHKEQRAISAFGGVPLLQSALRDARMQVTPWRGKTAALCKGKRERIDFEPLYADLGLKLQHLDPFLFEMDPAQEGK